MSDHAVVEGERVALRPVERDDSRFLRRATTDPDIRVSLGAAAPQNRHQAEEFLEETVEGEDSIALLVSLDGGPIGYVAAKHTDRPRPELVYWFVPERHGEGYGTEAVGLFAGYLFRTIDCHGLSARVYEFNGGSRGLLESLGFEREGRLRESWFARGEYVDVLRYGILRREWETRTD